MRRDTVIVMAAIAIGCSSNHSRESSATSSRVSPESTVIERSTDPPEDWKGMPSFMKGNMPQAPEFQASPACQLPTRLTTELQRQHPASFKARIGVLLDADGKVLAATSMNVDGPEGGIQHAWADAVASCAQHFHFKGPVDSQFYALDLRYQPRQ